MVGVDVKMPVALAPTGPDRHAARRRRDPGRRAAEAFGMPFTLSTMSICSIEDVPRTRRQTVLVPALRDARPRLHRAPDRPRQGRGCGALVLTLDLQILGQRHKDLKNGLSAPPKLTLANMINLMTKPRWCLGMLGTKRRQFGNIVGHVKGVGDMSSPVGAWTAEQFDPRLNWGDVEWIKKRWGGKLILKGIQDVEDARLAVDSGADALIVSNHGGRQLDGAQSQHRGAAGHRGRGRQPHRGAHGRRHPQRPGRAQGLALGARGTYIGRAFLYGLGAMGEEPA
jgi:L-lactate dehydrogenase (cytochrome)